MSVNRYFRVVCNSCGLELDAPAGNGSLKTEQQFVERIKELGWSVIPPTHLTAAAWICAEHKVKERP